MPYQTIDVNGDQEHIFHTKMLLNDFALEDYQFKKEKKDILPHRQAEIGRRLRREMAEIFYGKTLRRGLKI
jgi:S-adenosylmethionine decarboxylase